MTHRLRRVDEAWNGTLYPKATGWCKHETDVLGVSTQETDIFQITVATSQAKPSNQWYVGRSRLPSPLYSQNDLTLISELVWRYACIHRNDAQESGERLSGMACQSEVGPQLGELYDP